MYGIGEPSRIPRINRDFYALGAIIYALFCRSWYLELLDRDKKPHSLHDENFEILSSIPRPFDVPKTFVPILDKCLNPEPRKRYRSDAQLVFDLIRAKQYQGGQ